MSKSSKRWNCRHCGTPCKPGTDWCVRCKDRPTISGYKKDARTGKAVTRTPAR